MAAAIRGAGQEGDLLVSDDAKLAVDRRVDRRKMGKVLCVGIATLDHIFALPEMPRESQKYLASNLAVIGGGNAATAAYAIAKLGGEAGLATRLGDDATARDILGELEEAGVDCSLARRFPGHRS